MVESAEMCPALRVAKEGEFPPVVCVRGYFPKQDDTGNIHADPRCNQVAQGYSDRNCQKIQDEPILDWKNRPSQDIPRVG